MQMKNPNCLGIFIAGLLAVTQAANTAETAGEPKIKQVLIRNVSIWNGTADQATGMQNLLIENGLIKSVGDTPAPAADAQVIDGGGRLLIPGIIDAHTHLAMPIAREKLSQEDPAYVTALSIKAANGILMRGWTTVRDIGGPSQGLAKAIDENVAVGPRMYPSAMYITQTSGHGDFRDLNDPHPRLSGNVDHFAQRYSLIADGPAEVRRAVRESLRVGATAIKLMAGGGISSEFDPIDTVQYSLEELQAAVEAAADWNTYVAVHAYTDAAVLRALEAGVKVIEHGRLVSEATLRELKKRGAYLSSQSFGFVREYAPSAQSNRGRKAAQVMEGTDNLMNTAKKLGIPVAFGTDSFGSLRAYESAVKEFGYRLRWFNSLEILKQATSHNAKILALTGPRNPYPDGPLGIIEAGAYADLLIVDGDPLSDIRILQEHHNNIRLVMKNGEIYKNTLAGPPNQ